MSNSTVVPLPPATSAESVTRQTPRELVQSAFRQHNVKGCPRLQRIHVETLMHLAVKPGLSDFEQVQLKHLLDGASDPQSGLVDCELLVDWLYTSSSAPLERLLGRSPQVKACPAPPENLELRKAKSEAALPGVSRAGGQSRLVAAAAAATEPPPELQTSAAPVARATATAEEEVAQQSAEDMGAANGQQSQAAAPLPGGDLEVRLSLNEAAERTQLDVTASAAPASPCAAPPHSELKAEQAPVVLAPMEAAGGESAGRVGSNDAPRSDVPTATASATAPATSGAEQSKCAPASALPAACRAGNHLLVRFLLDAGAEVNSQLGDEGTAPLHISSARCDLGVTSLLLDRKADVHLQKADGMSALMLAAANQLAVAERQSEEVAQVLLKAGARVNMTTSAGWSALFYAVHRGSVPMVQLLLGAKADATMTSANGKRPLEVACHEGHLAVVQQLVSASGEEAPGDAAAAAVGRTPSPSGCHPQSHEALTTTGSTAVDTTAAEGSEAAAIAPDPAPDWQPSAPSTPVPQKQQEEESIERQELQTTTPSPNAQLMTEAGSLTPLAKVAESPQLEEEVPLPWFNAPAAAAAPEWPSSAPSTPLPQQQQEEERSERQELPTEVSPRRSEQQLDQVTPAAASTPTSPAKILKAAESPRREEAAALPQKKRSYEADAAGSSATGSQELDTSLPSIAAPLSDTSAKSSNTLHAACKAGNHLLVRFLLDAGADVDAQLADCVTPLHITSQSGDFELTSMLLERNADVHRQMTSGFSALMLATRSHASSGQECEVAAALLKAGAKVNLATSAGWTALLYACKQGSRPMVQLLLSSRADAMLATRGGRSPLEVACHEGHLAVVQQLLAAGVPAEAAQANGWSPLHSACHLQSAEVLEALLSRGADASALTDTGISGLHVAAKAGSEAAMRSLLRCRADMEHKDRNQKAPLHVCAENDRAITAAILLSAGASVSPEGPDGATPLHLACQGGHGTVVALLLGNKASLDSLMNGGTSCLHLAVHGGHEDVALLLLDSGISPVACTAKGWFPLFLAARRGHSRLIEGLLHRRADVRQSSRSGLTALHMAAQRGYFAAAKTLLDAAADPAAESQATRDGGHGSTPLAFAHQRGHSIVAKLLSIYAAVKSHLAPLRPACLTHASTWHTAGLRQLQRNTGRLYYELLLKQELVDPQVGWVSEHFRDTHGDCEDGVGDDNRGWAADGVRLRYWHSGSHDEPAWPRPWRQEDVVGLAVDIDAGQLAFSLNGAWIPGLQRAFRPHGHKIFPALSAMGDYVLHVPRHAWRYEPPSPDYAAWAEQGVFMRPVLPPEDDYLHALAELHADDLGPPSSTRPSEYSVNASVF